jgi:hypothetical protein
MVICGNYKGTNSKSVCHFDAGEIEHTNRQSTSTNYSEHCRGSVEKKHKKIIPNNRHILSEEAFTSEIGIQHLLIDLPSVDREDEGKIIGTQSILECKICK